MSAMKPARLTSALLTRKGMASPSAAPVSRANMVELLQAQSPLPAETPPAPATPVPAPGLGDLSDRIRLKKSGRKSKKSAPTLPRSSEKRVRVSLRLDADRHLRVKLLATHLNQTLQSVFTQAIDEYFERHNPDMLDAIPLLRGREGGEKGGNRRTRKTRGNRAKGQR